MEIKRYNELCLSFQGPRFAFVEFNFKFSIFNFTFYFYFSLDNKKLSALTSIKIKQMMRRIRRKEGMDEHETKELDEVGDEASDSNHFITTRT